MILVSLITVGYVGLGVRLVDIQVLQHDKHAAHALDNTRRKVIHASRRGDILDIRGTVLATSRIAKTVCADPSLVGTHQHLVARAIAPFLGRDAAGLAKRLQRRGRPRRGKLTGQVLPSGSGSRGRQAVLRSRPRENGVDRRRAG